MKTDNPPAPHDVPPLTWLSARRTSCWFVLLFVLAWLPGPASAQLFTNLQAFVNRLPSGDPSIAALTSAEGPKDIATADLDGDGHPDVVMSNTDGTVTVYFGRGDGRFSAPMHLHTGGGELRGIVCADFSGAGRTDIAVAAPYNGVVYFFFNQGGRIFSPVTNLATWAGARDLAAGDFDGDGKIDLAVAGTTNGLRQLRGLGSGRFALVTNLVELRATNRFLTFPKPVYSLVPFRPVGATRDELAITHAESDAVWVLGADASGVLHVNGATPNHRAHSLDVGVLTQPYATSPLPDLVTANRDSGTIEIHAYAPGPSRFSSSVAQTIEIPGGPRAVRIVDLDGDGWNDLVVALRNFDSVLTFRNDHGTFVSANEMPVGHSPRELVVADFNSDGHPDAAVMNRDSQDASILLTATNQVGFAAIDNLYLVDGEVVGLSVFDFNGDGHDDVIQLHRASGDFSVRLASTNGILGPPTFYTIGNVPATQVIVDVNNDHIPDQVVATLGVGVEPGFVSVRLGRGDGTFADQRRFYPPPEKEGRLFALVPGDFDGDGNIDLAAGYLDNRIAFFRGHGDGTFDFTREHPLVETAFGLVAGDFDQDGDLDLAAVGISGEMLVIENLGDLLTTTTLTTQTYPPPGAESFGARAIKAADLDQDGDLDLVIGSGTGALLYRGGPGMSFTLETTTLPGTNFPVDSIVLADFDHDGRKDLVLACRVFSCITFLTREADGTNFLAGLSVPVPSSDFLATGDLDGDGLPDLVGSGGSVLWTALSGHRPQITAPLVQQAVRTGLDRPVINELLAANNLFPVKADGDRLTDWVEVFNGSSAAFSLWNWRLQLIHSVTTNDSVVTTTNDFIFPATAFFARGAHLLVFCPEIRRTLYHTGFRLPSDGGTLVLRNPAGEEIDRVNYPAQRENVAYGRFKDGLASFVFSELPTPGAANLVNGPLEPAAKFAGVDPATLQPGQPIHFFATVTKDVNVASVSLIYQRLDVPNAPPRRIVLSDDGAHGDGAAGDGRYAGELFGGLPAAAEIQFYLEVVDLNNHTLTIPDEPVFARRGEPLSLYGLALDTSLSPLEISEVVSYNVSGLHDEYADTPDWVEVRNLSPEPLALAGWSLAHNIGDNARYDFPTVRVLAPGEHFVVFCDNGNDPGPLRAPFGLNRGGDQLILIRNTPDDARAMLDWVQIPALPADEAYARIGARGEWRKTRPTPYAPNTQPTPYAQNVVSTLDGVVRREVSGTTFTLIVATETNQTYTVEYQMSLGEPSWHSLTNFFGNGIEQTITLPLQNRCFFRVQRK